MKPNIVLLKEANYEKNIKIRSGIKLNCVIKTENI